jgi:hypothetical protein
MAAIGFKTTRMFFDRPAVQTAMDKGKRKVFSRFGAFVRTTAKRSIKKAPYMSRKRRGQKRTDFRTATSRPGHPPYNRTGLLKKFIFFSYDRDADSVVIGPERLNQKKGDAPAVLEYGGESRLANGKRIVIQARPFMGPAFYQEQSQLPKLWKDSVRHS